MLLEHSTWPEVADYLENQRNLIIPIGSTEQHGPTGLIGTDAICAKGIAEAVGDKKSIMVAPVINVGMAQHHTAFPGTITLRPSTLIQLLLDYLTSLTDAGFERFFFINGHGGNEATAMAAFSEFYLQLSRQGHPRADTVRCKLSSWWRHDSVEQLSQELFAGDEGSHATPSEVAITQYLFPDTAHHQPLDPLTGQPCIIYGPQDFRRRYPDGRVGSAPDRASAESGEQLFRCATHALCEEVERFIVAD